MIDGLKPYPAYKNSGLPWLGEIPAEWSVLRAKTVFGCIDVRSENGTEELLTVSSERGIVPRRSASVTMFKAASYQGHKLCWPDDLVINSLWAWSRGLGVSRYHGIVSTAYSVYRLRKGANFDPDFIHALVRSRPFHWELFVRSKGVWISRLQLTDSAFLDAPLVEPPKDEQLAIVRFLNHVDARIRGYIRAKQRVIALVAEERNKITHDAIHSADTRSMRLSAAAELTSRPIDRKEHKVYIPVGLFNRGRGIFHKQPVTGDELGDSTFYWIAEGDLVLSGQFAWEGAVAVAGAEDAGCVASHRYPILRGKPGEAESAYLYSFFRTEMGHLLLDHHSRGGAGRNRPLNIRTLMKERIPVPPIDLQRQIVAMENLESQLRQSTKQLVEALQEFRARLIADVVTGKLDVRAAAARLPEEVPETELVEEIDDLSQDDVPADETEPEVVEEV